MKNIYTTKATLDKSELTPQEIYDRAVEINEELEKVKSFDYFYEHYCKTPHYYSRLKVKVPNIVYLDLIL